MGWVMLLVASIIALVAIAWLPISLGIQALHRHQDDRPFAALGLLLVALGLNILLIALVGPQLTSALNLGKFPIF